MFYAIEKKYLDKLSMIFLKCIGTSHKLCEKNNIDVHSFGTFKKYYQDSAFSDPFDVIC